MKRCLRLSILCMILLLMGCPETEAPGLSLSMIVYHLAGGFAGFDERLTIHQDGRASLKSPSGEVTREIGRRRFLELEQLLLQADFFTLKDAYGDPNCADAFIKTVTVEGAPGQRSVTVFDCNASDLPPDFRFVLDQLEALRQELARI